MKKISLIMIIFACSSGISFAQEKKEEKFIEVKAYILKTIEERKKILIKEEACINLAKDKNALKNCFQEANEDRKIFKNREKFRK